MLPAILAKLGLPFFVQILSSVLAQIDNPVTKTASEALGKVDQAIKGGEISPAQIAEANRHTEKMAELETQVNQTSISEINQSLRAEIGSSDAYVRRMRPTFGYMVALTWAAQMFAIAYIIAFQTEKTVFVINAMANLGTIWAVGLSVLGVYVYKRSEEKKSAAGTFETIGWNKPKGS